MSIPQRRRTVEPEHFVITVTPDLAEKWLGVNTHNRHVRPAVVDRYARDMIEGEWQYNGDPIRISESNVVLDGQHRLLAVVQSGVSIRSLIVTGLPDESQNTMDIGTSRTMGDQLRLSGEKDEARLAAILRLAVGQSKGKWGPSSYHPTHAEMRAYLAEHPDLRMAVSIATRARKDLPCRPSLIGAIYHACAQIDRGDAELFFGEQLCDGIGLFPTDPAHVLRRKLRDDTARARTPGETTRRLNGEDVTRYTLLAWNLFRAGKKVQKLQAPKGGWLGKFPEPK